MTTKKQGKKSAASAPHDTLVKEYYQHPENAKDLIKWGLAPEMLAELKLETLRHEALHLSTRALLKSVTDLVFTCERWEKTAEPTKGLAPFASPPGHNDLTYVHILLEHKAQPDALVAVQVLKYMVLIWDYYRRKKKGSTRMPFVVPLIFYHGKKRWEPKPLTAFFPQDSLFMACVPQFLMPVCNLHTVSAELLHADMPQSTMLLFLKALLEKFSAQRVAHVLHYLNTINANADFREEMELFFNYLGQVRPEITMDSVDEELSKLPGGMDMGQTFQEQWAEYSFKKGALLGEARGRTEGIVLGEARGRTEGIVLGEARGRTEGRHTLLTRQLTRKFGREALTPALQQRLQAATIDQLDHWGERLLDAQSVDEVFWEN